LQAITEAYGTDQGLALWETIANTLDPDVKGQIFFAMITGSYNDTIVLRGSSRSDVYNKVACIKEIRTWTGMGLKEAKDVVDCVESGKNVRITVKPIDHTQAVRALRRVGFEA
jgi:hypothetical protein